MTPLYIRQLQAGVEVDLARHAAEVELNRKFEVNTARDRLTPLDERLSRLLATVPADLQREGLSLPTLRTMLRGRRGGACSSGELGTALRRLGWSRERCWHGGEDGSFSALWRPPS